MEAQKGQEKRRFARTDIIVPIKYRLYRNNSVFQSSFNIGKSRNLSMGGLKFAVSKHLPVGTKLDMELELSRTMGIYVVAQVVGGDDEVVNGITHRYDRVTFSEVDTEVQDLLMRLMFEIMKRNSLKNK